MGGSLVSHRWLVLRLEAPLMSFGGVQVDQIGPVRDFPASSMITGLIGNALGLHWSDRTALQAIQDRLIFGVRIEREGRRLTDVQNAKLEKTDLAWTTSGRPAERRGGADTYGSPHRRHRDYHADRRVWVVLRFEPDKSAPTLDDLSQAFDRPSRPLFLGRKACLPSAPILGPGPERWTTGETAHEALCTVSTGSDPRRALWPVGQGPDQGEPVDFEGDRADLRDWIRGVHSGSRQVVEGWIHPRGSG